MRLTLRSASPQNRVAVARLGIGRDAGITVFQRHGGSGYWEAIFKIPNHRGVHSFLNQKHLAAFGTIPSGVRLLLGAEFNILSGMACVRRYFCPDLYPTSEVLCHTVSGFCFLAFFHVAHLAGYSMYPRGTLITQAAPGCCRDAARESSARATECVRDRS